MKHEVTKSTKVHEEIFDVLFKLGNNPVELALRSYISKLDESMLLTGFSGCWVSGRVWPGGVGGRGGGQWEVGGWGQGRGGGGGGGGGARGKRFRGGGRWGGRLNHADVGTSYGVGEQGGRPYIVMEYVDGGSLAEQVRA